MGTRILVAGLYGRIPKMLKYRFFAHASCIKNLKEVHKHVHLNQHHSYYRCQAWYSANQPRNSSHFKQNQMFVRIISAFGVFIFLIIIVKLGKNKFHKGATEGFEKYKMPFTKDRDGLVKVKGVWLPYIMVGKKTIEHIGNLQVNSDDIFVVSYPKSGTTWVQEIVYLLRNKDRILTAYSENLNEKFPFLEFPYPGLEVIAKSKGPRLIKTHLPFELLPKTVCENKPKIIYIARNVKDVSVSYYHFHRMWTQVDYSGTLNDFLQDFKAGQVAYGSWWDHVKTYWDKKSSDNVLFLKYEDLHQV